MKYLNVGIAGLGNVGSNLVNTIEETSNHIKKWRAFLPLKCGKSPKTKR